MNTTPDMVSLSVTGLSCGGCVDAFTASARSLPYIEGCDVTLVPNGVSTAVLTVLAQVAPEQLVGDLDAAGYAVTIES